MLRDDDIQYCKRIQRRYGKNYYFATYFFPKKMRVATYVLYAFFRVPDEMVDNPESGSDPERILGRWMRRWKQAYKSKVSDHPVLRAAAAICHQYQIPFEETERFLEAMVMDLHKSRYSSYEELCEYMDGSAAAVGVMMSYVIGFSDASALKYARDLGYAMQVTNFLRDVQEDADDRGRIYLPQDMRKRHGVSDEDVLMHRFDAGFAELMEELGTHARSLYRSAEKGVSLLAPRGRFAVRVAARLYEALLDKLEAQGWDPFAKRVRLSLLEKIRYLFI